MSLTACLEQQSRDQNALAACSKHTSRLVCVADGRQSRAAKRKSWRPHHLALATEMHARDLTGLRLGRISSTSGQQSQPEQRKQWAGVLSSSWLTYSDSTLAMVNR